MVYPSTPRSYVDGVLGLGFGSTADVDAFRPTGRPGENAADHLRSAINEILGIQVKFLPRVDGGRAAPSSEGDPVETRLTSGVSTGSTHDPARVEPVETAPARVEPVETRDPAPSWNVVTIPSTSVASDDLIEAESATGAPPVEAAPTGAERYGESVVRELLKASFIGEQQLDPADRPVALVDVTAPAVDGSVDSESRGDFEPAPEDD